MHKNGRYPSRAQKRNQRFLFRSVGHRKDFTEPSRYVAIANECNCRIYRRRKYLRVVFFGKILYKRSVVGNNTYFINTKMGGRTSLFLTSQRMPSRYVLRLQVYIIIKFWYDTHKEDSQIN